MNIIIIIIIIIIIMIIIILWGSMVIVRTKISPTNSPLSLKSENAALNSCGALRNNALYV